MDYQLTSMKETGKKSCSSEEILKQVIKTLNNKFDETLNKTEQFKSKYENLYFP